MKANWSEDRLEQSTRIRQSMSLNSCAQSKTLQVLFRYYNLPRTLECIRSTRVRLRAGLQNLDRVFYYAYYRHLDSTVASGR